MKFCEYFGRPDLENPEEIRRFLEFAKAIGFSGIGLAKPEAMDTAKYLETIGKFKKENQIDIVSVFEVSKPGQLKTIRQIRRDFEIIAAKNMGLEQNRQAIETEGIDALICPYTPAYNGLNYVMARLARENNVSIGFSLKDLIFTDKRTRADLFRNMLEAAKFAKKARCKIVLTSEPITKWDLRSHSELLSFGRVLGFQDPQIKEGLSGKLAETNREKMGNLV